MAFYKCSKYNTQRDRVHRHCPSWFPVEPELQVLRLLSEHNDQSSHLWVATGVPDLNSMCYLPRIFIAVNIDRHITWNAPFPVVSSTFALMCNRHHHHHQSSFHPVKLKLHTHNILATLSNHHFVLFPSLFYSQEFKEVESKYLLFLKAEPTQHNVLKVHPRKSKGQVPFHDWKIFHCQFDFSIHWLRDMSHFHLLTSANNVAWTWDIAHVCYLYLNLVMSLE